MSGPEPAGREPSGPAPAVPEHAGPEHAGPNPAGPNPAGPDPAGPDPGRDVGRAVIDPDVDLRDPAQRAETAGAGMWRVPAVIAAGGALGSAARYAVSLARPVTDGAFPWAVLVVNVTGCALIGVLMVLLAERRTGGSPLLRPFLGVGVLGGFTTFSTYAADVSKLLVRQEVFTAMLYATVTVVAALGAVWGAAAATRALVDGRGPAA